MAKNKKPVGEKLGRRRLKTRRPFRNKVFTLRVDRVKLPGGKRTETAYLERSDAVIIVPVTDNGEMILIRHYRHAIDAWEWEVPAGGWKGTRVESLKEAARRELREETGGTCRALKHVGWFYSATSLTNERCQVFFARGVRLMNAPRRGPAESLEIQVLPVAEALALVHAGKMKDGQCALAIFLCEPLLAGRRP
ncbi:MAG: NUDIX hydrolase [Chthoniobacterales bacterium]|nr:NUDIX hydrolase [Chthoniobacterales bacterium]